MQPCISIIIPHLNQNDSLHACLSAIEQQSGTFQLNEIIVVDNGSRVLPTYLRKKFDNVVLLEESLPGPGLARNTGVATATGDVFTFLDADCIPARDWLSIISGQFANNTNLAILGGAVHIERKPNHRPTSIQAYELIFSFRMEEYIRSKGYAGTGNLAIRRDVFDTVGPFKGIHVAEDMNWGQRANKLGYFPQYAPDMIVYHPARRNFAELAHKWDRHIAHEYKVTAGLTDHIRWALRALAIAVSPVAEIPRILKSKQALTLRERWQAFICLYRIRLYRAYQMLKLLFKDDSQNMSGSWNRD